MGYYRHIIAKELPVKLISLALDEDRAVLRFLFPLEKESYQTQERREGNLADLITTQRLSSPFRSIEETTTYYEFQGKQYVIFAEGILDRREEEFSKLWVPGTHFEFHYHPMLGIKIDPRGALHGPSRRNTAELIRYMGGLWLFGLWVTNPKTPVCLCNRSITTAPDTTLITNLTELGETQTAEYVMQGGRSKWLTFNYRLTAERESVLPNGVMNYTFEVLDGKTGEIAKDISWDGWRIEAVDGYAPHHRINVINGVGHFQVMAWGLKTGETMRVKIQNRFDPSIAECTVRVA